MGLLATSICSWSARGLLVFQVLLSVTTALEGATSTTFGTLAKTGSTSGEVCLHDSHHLLHCMDSPDATKTRGISQELLEQLKLFAQYSAATYCPDNNNSPNTTISCGESHKCPLVEAVNATSSAEWEERKPYDDHGYIAVDDVHRTVVLAFRGAQSATNWRHSLNAHHVDSDFCDDCKVHNGFWKMWTDIREKVFADVDRTLAKYPGYRFVITGHSLGGALATLAAGSFRMRDDRYANLTEVFTYGSPRVGTGMTAAFLTRQSDKSYRVTSGKDLIPRLPPAFLGYLHVSPEYWIKNYFTDPKPGDIDVLTGAYNNQGNAGIKHGHMRKKYHRQYFMKRISGCKA